MEGIDNLKDLGIDGRIIDQNEIGCILVLNSTG
jgi:hypothetical protein